MSWTHELEELERRKEYSLRMGGPEKIKRQHDAGKLDIRQRIGRLVDGESFLEVGGWRAAANTTSRAGSRTWCRRT